MNLNLDMALRFAAGWYGNITSIENKDARIERRGKAFIATANGKRRMGNHPVAALCKCYGIY